MKEKRNTKILLSFLIIIVLFIIFLILNKSYNKNLNSNNIQRTTIETSSISKNQKTKEESYKNITSTPAGGTKNEKLDFTPPLKTITLKENATLNEYLINITENGFEPQNIVIKRGNVAQLDIINTNNYPVDIKINNAGLYIPFLKTGVKTIISFDASKEGNFEVVCDKYCPPGIKLLGKLFIES